MKTYPYKFRVVSELPPDGNGTARTVETAMALDQDTLVRLLLTHRAMVLGYLTSMVRDIHLAEDIFQDVALVVMRKGGVLGAAEEFPVWVRRVARLEAMNALRKRRQGLLPLSQAVLEQLESHWRTRDAESPAAVNALQRCMERLSERAQELVRLRYADGIKGKDLADRLARPLNTVYVSLSRVHRALADCVRMRLSAEGLNHD
jgi:RNA polymerase sigma-70 factor (ECF subfamily)